MDDKKPIQFVEKYKNLPFSRWKGGSYKFYLYENEIEFFYWIFENKLQDEIKYKKIDGWSQKKYSIYFKTPEAFMAFKIFWL